MSDTVSGTPGPSGRLLGLEIGGRPFARIIAGVLAAALTAMIVAPRASPFYLGILGLLGLALVLRRDGRIGSLGWSDPLVAVAGIFAIYAAVSALWSADPAEAVKLSALFALAVLLVTQAAAWVLREEGERLSRLGLALLIAFGLGLAYLLVEMLTGQALKRLLFNTLEATRPDGVKNLQIRKGLVTSIHLNTLNRQVAALTLLAWPALLAAMLWPRPRARRVLLALFAVGTLVAVFKSEHETSKAALIAGTAAFALHRMAPGLLWQALRAAWVVAVIGIVPIALLAHDMGLHEAGWIQSTGRARIMLWNTTAEETLKSPIIGIGAASTKAIDEQRKAETALEEALAGATKADRKEELLKSFESRTGRHAHNVYLQTWFELGLVGALGLLAIGLLVIARLSRLPERARPFGAAFLSVAMVMAGLSWGLWQPWFVPVFLLAGLALVVAVRVGDRDAFAFFAGPHISERSRQAS